MKIVLNRLGAIRLLNTIEKQCARFHLSNNWESIKRNSNIKLNSRIEKENKFSQRNDRQHRNGAAVGNVTTLATRSPNPAPSLPVPGTYVLSPSHQGTSRPGHPPTQPSRVAPSRSLTMPVQRASSYPTPPTVQRPYRNSTQSVPVRRFPTYSYAEATKRSVPQSVEVDQDTRRQDVGRGYNHGTPSDWSRAEQDSWAPGIPSSVSHATYGTQYTRGSYHYRRGCFNCGEHNHRQTNCRFDHRLRCTLFHQLGHKQRMCKNYSQ